MQLKNAIRISKRNKSDAWEQKQTENKKNSDNCAAVIVSNGSVTRS